MKNITGHPLLTEEAGDLDGPVLAAHADLAARVLELEGHVWSGLTLGTARTAIVMQVNRQVRKELEPEVFLAASWGRGQRNKSYADAAREVVDPTAKALANQLLDSRGLRYRPVVRSRR